MEGLLQGRKDGALFGQRFFLSVCSRRISIGRARLVFAAGLEAGPGRPVCLCACLVLETVFGIECVRVCVCVPCQICLKGGSGKTLSVAMEPCLARLVFAADEQWSWGFRTKD